VTIGKRIRIGGNSRNPWMTIVGVVGDIVHNAYDREPRRTYYIPYQQAPATWMDVGVRTAGDPLRLAPAVTAAVRSVAPEQPITDLRTIEQPIHNGPTRLSYAAALTGACG